MLFVRSFKNDDLEQVLKLRRETILLTNNSDYSIDQINAWIGSDTHEERVRRLNIFNASYTIIAEEADEIVGYANYFIEQQYLDQLYVAKDHQKMGVGSALLSAIEEKALVSDTSKISLESSITAKQFFEKQGYRLILQQQKLLTPNLSLTNYIMEKILKIGE